MANVGIGRNGFGLEVERIAHILGLPREESEVLMHDAHEVYLYSKATRGNIEVEPSVARALGVMERHLSGREFFLGDGPTTSPSTCIRTCVTRVATTSKAFRRCERGWT